MTDTKPKQPPATTAATAATPPVVRPVLPTPQAPPVPPSPLLIGKAFIKQYYQVLSTNPTQITKFYKPNSLISHSLLPSVPATTTTLLEQTDLFSWCKPKNTKDKICFDFGKGAIDAQETINGGILLVVTGHVRLDDGHGNGASAVSVAGEDAQNMNGNKRFVHTFFLNNGAPAGKKRQFYVHNDVLRFLDEGLDLSLNLNDVDEQVEVEEKDVQEEQEQEVGDKVTGDETVQAKTKPQEKEEPVAAAVVEVTIKTTPVEKDETPKDTKDEPKKEKEVFIDSKSKVVEECKDVEHAIAAKEDKVAAPAISAPEGKKGKSTESGKDAEVKKDGKEIVSVSASDSAKPAKSDEKKGKSANTTTTTTNTTATTTTAQEKKPRKNKSRGRARKSRSSSPTDVGNSNGSKGKKAAVPSSWASLVARSGPSVVVADAAAVVENTKGEKESAAPASAANASTSNASNSTSGNTNANAKKSSNGAAKQESTSEKQKGEQASSDQESRAQVQQQQQQQQQPHLSKKAAVALRQPEATVLIKNIPAKTLEPEIRAMFEPFASKLQKRVLGITLLPNRGFCFVDFDSKAVVDAIVKDVEAEKEAQTKSKKEGEDVPVSKFIVNGRVLEVGRKIPAEKAVSGGRGRGPRRSSSPNRGGYKNNRGGGRRNSPRGGNRSANKK